MRKLHLVCFVILMVSLFLAVAPAFAQDTLPAPTGDVAATLAAALEMLTKVVAAVTALPFTVGFVTAATALVKRYLPLSISGGAIALFFQVLAWVAWILALH